MALASSGPTQSIAVGIVGLMVAVMYHTFLPILICFIPMIGIAIGYQRLNAWQPSAGATYSWVGRALNPHAGFFVGWIMLMYYTIGTTSLTVPLGTYFLSFFSDAAANNKYDVAIVGSHPQHPRADRRRARHQAVGALQLGLGDLRVRADDRLRDRRPRDDLRHWALGRRAHRELAVHAAQGRPHHRSPDRHLPVLRLGHRRLRRRGGQGQAGRAAPRSSASSSCSSSTRS